MTQARLITFEGGEGAGKSTQIAKLADSLMAQGVSLITTHEPGGTPSGARLRELLMSDASGDWPVMAEALLMLADRAIHLEQVIRPALADGVWVLCDRYMDSTRAYQGGAGGLGVAAIDALQASVIGATMPDLTVLLDVAPEIGLARAHKRGDVTRFEEKELAYHSALRQSFLALADDAPQRFVVLDGAGASDEIAQAILAQVQERFLSGA